MKRKIIPILTIIFVMSFVLSGCFGPFVDDNDEEEVWTNYEGDYFKFDYPVEWEECEEDYLVVNETEGIGGRVLFGLDEVPETVEEFLEDTPWEEDDGDFKALEVDGEQAFLVENYRNEYDNYVSYIYIAQEIENEDIDEDYVISNFIYIAESAGYYNKELGKTILTSIIFTDDPDSGKLKEYDLNMLAPCDYLGCKKKH